MIRKHLTYEICQRKFGCVKGAYIMQYKYMTIIIQIANGQTGSFMEC